VPGVGPTNLGHNTITRNPGENATETFDQIAINAEYFMHTHPVNFGCHDYSPEGGPSDYIEGIKGDYVISDQGVWLVTTLQNTKGVQVLGPDWINEVLKRLKSGK
ncbi:MAG: hypothetical protein WAO19_13225, partial [Candidatus Kryptoniota bacterium]